MYHQRPMRWSVTLIPALLTTVAYVDPGNFASNIGAGALHGYSLVWVVVLASGAAALIQYLAGLLGMATGGTLASLTAGRLPRAARITAWLQAELVVLMTDLAELVGGAIGLYLVFGLPLPVGACVIAGISLLALVGGARGSRASGAIILGLLGVVAATVWGSTALARPSIAGSVAGLVPGALDASSVLLATAIVGATVMPHALYFHSATSADAVAASPPTVVRAADPRRRLSRSVLVAMGAAGCVNLALLLVGATLPAAAAEGLEQAHAVLAAHAGQLAATLMGVALIASGLASTIVGVVTGQVVMEGYLSRAIPVWTRRLIALVPPMVVLALGLDPTKALVASQVVLALALPLTLAPLVVLTSSSRVMGSLRPGRPVLVAAAAVTAIITVLDLALVALVVTGHV